jgi:pyruvate-formate lyase-activating enzyme
MTDNCNHHCPKCVGGRKTGINMDRQDAIGYISQLANYGVKGIIFTGGGEPLFNENTSDVVKYAKEQGLDVGFITNGGLLTKRSCNVLVDNCTWIRVSLDAITSDIYKLVHGMNEKELEKVKNNIEMLGKTKIERKSLCTIGVGFLTNSKTKKDMVECANIISCFEGINYLQFRPFHNDTTNIDAEIIECKKFENENFKILSSSQKYEEFGHKRNYDYCHAAHFVGVIQSDSKMTICCHTRGNKNHVIGDLKQNSFEEIWEGETKKNILKKLDVNTCVPYCRGDHLNRCLHDLTTPKDHENFL